MVVKKDMIIGDLLMVDEGVAPILMSAGLHCLGCVLASGETIEEACVVHGIDCDSLVEELNNYMQSVG
ncbi:MAG: DUF1858 domain-containing protein [Clostridia bacterium]|nr:DUF1858 domain-containing protein [Clostridiales bacterium]MCR5804746.1 DUF1858 domain-containing protein [Clostridia bacterium]